MIDICNNFSEIATLDVTKTSEIKNYYLSDALLQMSISKKNYYYNDLIREAVFNDELNDSPCCINSITKAYFKDGNVDYALEFFESSIKQIKYLQE